MDTGAREGGRSRPSASGECPSCSAALATPSARSVGRSRPSPTEHQGRLRPVKGKRVLSPCVRRSALDRLEYLISCEVGGTNLLSRGKVLTLPLALAL